MIGFLLKGLLRDRSRSLFPLLTVASGVALTVMLHGWLYGVLNSMLDVNAKFQTGHLKVMTLAYAEQEEQFPNDLACTGVESLLVELRNEFPDIVWTARIRFGGLLDVPDSTGETRAQGPAFGMAFDLFTATSPERRLLKLQQALVRGRLPHQANEILMSDEFARKLGVGIGETATLLSTTMYGSVAMHNFTVAGTVVFGISAMDRGAIIADISDVQRALDMENSAGEILGFLDTLQFEKERTEAVKMAFNQQHSDPDDDFSHTMLSLRDQNGLGELLDLIVMALSLVVGIFLFVMFIVLWNAGLMASLRRYGEIGVRLATGEDKGHLYRAMLLESFMLGLIGSALGTIVGLAISTYLQNHGLDFSSFSKNSSLFMDNVFRAQVTPGSYVIGFIPGLIATVLGTTFSGIGIYKRQTSQLFKELEV